MPGSLVLLGFIGMTAQAAYLREIMATFRGGELIIGVALLFWLLWTASGSVLSGIKPDTGNRAAQRFFSLIPWYGLFGYTGVLAIRHLPVLARLTPGEMVSYDLQLVAIVVAFIPCNILGGYLFVLGARVLGSTDLSPVGRAYILEAIGAALGGITVSLVLVGIVPNDLIAASCTILAIAVTIWGMRRLSIQMWVPRLVLPVLFAAGAFFFSEYLDTVPYRGQELLVEHDTRYGRLRVTRTGNVTTFYDNASTLFSYPDPERSEYSAHIPLLAAKDKKRVLILGGGPGGVIDEVLRWNAVERVLCVELDPALLDLSERLLDEQWRDDPRVETFSIDGRAYLARTGEIFDVAIMNMPPPLTGVANRYYTSEFFKLVAEHLSPGGIFTFTMTGAENYIPDTLAGVLASVRVTLETVFPSVSVLPGDQCRFLAGLIPGMSDDLGWETFSNAHRESGLDLLYVRDYYLRYLFAPERIAFLNNAIDNAPVHEINTDTRPIVFVNRTLFEGELGGSFLLRMVRPLLDRQVVLTCAAFLLAVMLGIAFFPGKSGPVRAVGVTVVSVGLTEISLEVLAILAYQSYFGLLYARVALLTGLYMAGLAIGGGIGMRLLEHRRSGTELLAIIQMSIALLAVVWISLLAVTERGYGNPVFLETGFYILTTAAGITGGVQFPLADKLFRRFRKTSQTRTGFVYALDLAGSSIGALATSSFMIPLTGMTFSLVFLAVLNAGIACSLYVRRRAAV